MPLILQESEVTATTTADGVVVHEIAAGFGDGLVEGTRFLPETIVIYAGEAVRWVNPDPEPPHTITFFPGGTLDALDNPPADTPPGFPFAPFGGNVYSGQEFINSGALWNEDRFRMLSVGDTFDLRFTTPGTYQYACIFHVGQRMFGTVVVLPSSGK